MLFPLIFLSIGFVNGVSQILNGSFSMDHAARASIFGSPCVVGLIDKYLETSEKVWGSTVILSIMLNSVFRQRFYLEALNSYEKLTFMIKRADIPHYSTAWVKEKAQIYFIFITEPEDIIDHVTLFKRLPTYSSSAKIIGLFLTDLKEEEFKEKRELATKILYERDFFDIFMMGMKENTSILQTYTMFPYENGNCAKNVNPLELIDECEFMAKDRDPVTIHEVMELSRNLSNMRYVEYKSFYPKLPETIRGCQIKVTTSSFEPYVVMDKRTKTVSKGIEIKLMNETFKEIGATADFLVQDPKLRYLKRSLDNSSVYKAILLKESPFLVGGFMRTPEMNSSVTVSNPYAYDDVTWCVHTAALAEPWLNTFKTYSWQLWIVIGISIFSCSIFLYLLIKYENESKHQNLTWSFLNIFGTIISMFTVQYFPNKIFIRIFMASILFAGINLWAAYTSSLISFLTKPRYDEQISSIPEALAQGYTFYGSINYLEFIKNNKMREPGYAEIVNHYQVCNSLEQCFKSFSLNKKSAIATSRIQALYNSESISIEKYCFDRSNNIYEYSVTVSVFPFHHLLPTLNEMIGHVLQSGLIIKWMHDVEIQKENEEIEQIVQLSLRNLEGVFVMLGIGTILAIVAFFVEWAYFIHKHGQEKAWMKFKMIGIDMMDKDEIRKKI